MHVTSVSLTFIGVFTASLALAQGIEPQNGRQPGVIEKWSSELLETAGHKVEAAELAVRIMEQLRQRTAASGEKIGSLDHPSQWPPAYAEVLSRYGSASLPPEISPRLQSEVSLPAIANLPFERRTSPESSQGTHPWEPIIGQILKSEGLPPELLAVPRVESGFNPSAISPKGARGLWQLMPDTARHFGLRVDAVVDERTDPLRSTAAAIAYLKNLYGSLGNWPLALAAYNAGLGRVVAAIQRGAPTFASMAARRLLPEETLRYVPLVLGTSEVMSFHGGDADQTQRFAGR